MSAPTNVHISTPPQPSSIPPEPQSDSCSAGGRMVAEFGLLNTLSEKRSSVPIASGSAN